MGTAPKVATTHTLAANAPVDLGFDPADFERATRGLVAEHPTGVIETAHGVVWDVHRWEFVERDSANPDTVNPNLWRQAQLNGIHGLFEVADAVSSGDASANGDVEAAGQIFGHLDTFMNNFPLVEP